MPFMLLNNGAEINRLVSSWGASQFSQITGKSFVVHQSLFVCIEYALY